VPKSIQTFRNAKDRSGIYLTVPVFMIQHNVMMQCRYLANMSYRLTCTAWLQKSKPLPNFC